MFFCVYVCVCVFVCGSVLDDTIEDCSNTYLQLTILTRSLSLLLLHAPQYYYFQFTNGQSRTAIAIMPALFMFAFAGESKLIHRMHEVAAEEEHAMQTVNWAEEQLKNGTMMDKEHHDLYRQAILEQGHVRLIDEPELSTYHHAANYVQANPFKVILGVGVPSVAAIFYGQGSSLNFQLQLLHTRVFGQAAIITTLLGVMGVKATMDAQGRYVTNQEVEDRVQEMQATRLRMLSRIEEANESAQQVQKGGVHAMVATSSKKMKDSQ